MPDMDGFEATKYIREHFEAPVKNTPIIALTASVLRIDIDRCRQAGMDSYIPKPFKAVHLITGIAQVLHIALKTEKKKENVTSGNYTTWVTDLGYLHKFCEGDEERIKKYIKIYLDAAAGFEGKALVAHEAKDFEALATLVHSFKPKWMMMGMKQSMELGQKIERCCNEKDGGGKIEEYLTLLIEEVRLSVGELASHT